MNKAALPGNLCTWCEGPCMPLVIHIGAPAAEGLGWFQLVCLVLAFRTGLCGQRAGSDASEKDKVWRPRILDAVWENFAGHLRCNQFQNQPA